MPPTARQAARLVVLDPDGALLLVGYRDDRGPWWATPGGGVEVGERLEDAARREAREELALAVTDLEPLWSREVEFTSNGQHIRQVEQFFLVRVRRDEVALGAARAEHEREGITEARWWSVEELRRSGALFFPEDLLDRVVDLLGSFAAYRLPLAADAELFPDGPPERIGPGTVAALIRARPQGDAPAPLKYDTVALDLEGTLISNAMSQFPRAGLFELLERCKAHIPRVVIYTAVSERLFRPIAATLVNEQLAPPWFADIEYVDWSGPHKDLAFIDQCDPSRALLVDDNPDYVVPSQRDQWIRVPEFAAPYEVDDALAEVWRAIKSKNGKAYVWP